MRLFWHIFIVFLLFSSCKEREARRPLNVKTESFFDASVARNKKMLTLEADAIKKIMKEDSLNTYYTSASGFWYCYHIKDSTGGSAPEKDDLVLINYNVRNLNNDVIYTKEEIGDINLKMEREMIFPGLNNALKLMKKGETLTFLFPSYLAYGYHGDGNKIGINTPLISTVFPN